MQVRRGAAVTGLAAIVAASLLLHLQVAPSLAGEAGSSGLVGAHVHSAWFEPSRAVPESVLVDLVETSGLEVVAFGVPLASEAARGAGVTIAASFLSAMGKRPAIPQLNTLALPAGGQTEAGLAAFFAPYARLFESHANVLVAVGANEPLTRGKGWALAELAEERVRLEYRLWHEASDLPFCHKFTNPEINAPGLSWARMERLWETSQDAICYDWYASNGDTVATLDRLREVADRLGKPLHVLETAVPGDAPAMLVSMTALADTVTIYQLLSSEGGADERLSAFVLRGGTPVPRAPARLLPGA